MSDLKIVGRGREGGKNRKKFCMNTFLEEAKDHERIFFRYVILLSDMFSTPIFAGQGILLNGRITFEDLVVLSFPGSDRFISMENLRAGKAISRCYRNRGIGEFLKELDMTEGRSTGIPKILRAMKDNGSPRPEFETDDDRQHFLIRLPVHPKANVLMIDHDKAPVEAPVVFAGTDQKIIISLKDHDLARQELLRGLGYSQPTGNFKKAIERLLQQGFIERTIPDKPNSLLQKYRLTKKGKEQIGAVR